MHDATNYVSLLIHSIELFIIQCPPNVSMDAALGFPFFPVLSTDTRGEMGISRCHSGGA